VHTPYHRYVITDDGRRLQIGVHRYRCTCCGRTVSFLPAFAVPYKHFGSGVIEAVLDGVFTLNLSLRAVHRDAVLNRAGFSLSACREWRRQFCTNRANLLHEGLKRLGVDSGDAVDPAAVWDCVRHVSLAVGQEQLSRGSPPFGVFRSLLVPWA